METSKNREIIFVFSPVETRTRPCGSWPSWSTKGVSERFRTSDRR